MAKVFNVTAVCKPEKNYMVDISSRLKSIKKLVDDGKYFSIIKARQYGKTTVLRALANYLRKDYIVVFMDFQTFGSEEFANENVFSLSFATSFANYIRKTNQDEDYDISDRLKLLITWLEKYPDKLRLKQLFEQLSDICKVANKPIVLLIDEVDSASNNQVFLDFLAQLRAYYIDKDEQPTFHSVILAGVYDIRN